MGLRREESRDRAKRIPWRRNERMSVAGREVYDWLPIFDLTTADVFHVIHEAGQKPHWVYNHLSRCSCSFCIFASRSDLRRAAELRPALYRQYVALERRIGHTLSPSRMPLPELTGIPVEPAASSVHPFEHVRRSRRTVPSARTEPSRSEQSPSPAPSSNLPFA